MDFCNARSPEVVQVFVADISAEAPGCQGGFSATLSAFPWWSQDGCWSSSCLIYLSGEKEVESFVASIREAKLTQIAPADILLTRIMFTAMFNCKSR